MHVNVNTSTSPPRYTFTLKVKESILLTRFDRIDEYESKSATSSSERLREESALSISYSKGKSDKKQRRKGIDQTKRPTCTDIKYIIKLKTCSNKTAQCSNMRVQ